MASELRTPYSLISIHSMDPEGAVLILSLVNTAEMCLKDECHYLPPEVDHGVKGWEQGMLSAEA